jgi:hypothetical protein
LIVISLAVFFGTQDPLCVVLCGDNPAEADHHIAQRSEQPESCHDAEEPLGAPTDFSLDCATDCSRCDESRASFASIFVEPGQVSTVDLPRTLPASIARTRRHPRALDIDRAAPGYSGHQIVIRKSSLLL